MKNFTDIHCHMLWGVDDGPGSEEKTKQMIAASYEDGVRTICFTPHFHPAIYGKNKDKSEAALEKLRAYVKEAYPDLELYIGNELRYDVGYLDWVRDGNCRTLNGTKNILLDFSEYENASVIIKTLESILAAGYIPVLAHAERYRKLHFSMRQLMELSERGVVIQVDAQSVFGGWGFSSKVRSRKLLRMRMADIVASDAHNLSDRPPQLSKCYEYVASKCSERYAEAIFCRNPSAILGK